MELLENDQQRRIAEYHLTGYTNEEIASFMGVSLRTVKRRLSRIRELWEAGAEP
jgi:DNA-directed RNA polymerase specialized sigma24 family protein